MDVDLRCKQRSTGDITKKHEQLFVVAGARSFARDCGRIQCGGWVFWLVPIAALCGLLVKCIDDLRAIFLEAYPQPLIAVIINKLVINNSLVYFLDLCTHALRRAAHPT